MIALLIVVLIEGLEHKVFLLHQISLCPILNQHELREEELFEAREIYLACLGGKNLVAQQVGLDVLSIITRSLDHNVVQNIVQTYSGLSPEVERSKRRIRVLVHRLHNRAQCLRYLLEVLIVEIPSIGFAY